MELAKKKWTAFCDYVYDIWVNVGFVQLLSYMVANPKLGKFTWGMRLGIYDTLQRIEKP